MDVEDCHQWSFSSCNGKSSQKKTAKKREETKNLIWSATWDLWPAGVVWNLWPIRWCCWSIPRQSRSWPLRCWSVSPAWSHPETEKRRSTCRETLDALEDDRVKRFNACYDVRLCGIRHLQNVRDDADTPAQKKKEKMAWECHMGILTMRMWV